MSGKEDGETTPRLNNGTSMVFQRPSRTTTGSLTHLTFKATEDQPTLDAQLPIQGGGKSGDTKVDMLSMREARSLKFRTLVPRPILNKEIS